MVRIGGVRLFIHVKDGGQFMAQPDTTGRTTEEMEIFTEQTPDSSRVACNQGLKWNSLRVQHARYIMIGDDEQVGRCTKGCVRVGKETRIDMPMRTDQRK